MTSMDGAPPSPPSRRTRRRRWLGIPVRIVAVLTLAVTGLVATAGAALAHHADISATINCSKVATVTATSWIPVYPTDYPTGTPNPPPQSATDAARTNGAINVYWGTAQSVAGTPTLGGTGAFSTADGFTFTLSFTVTGAPGSTVWFRADTTANWGDGQAPDGGPHYASATIPTNCGPTPPSVTLPCAANIVFGQPATFTATPSGGTGPYTYAWTLNGTPVAGTGPSVTVTINAATDRLVVTLTDSTGATATATATNCSGATPLSVTLPCVHVVVGQPATFIATPSGGTGTYTYTWTLNGNPVVGTGPTVTVTMNAPTDVLRVVVTSGGQTAAATATQCTGQVLAVSLPCAAGTPTFGQPATFTAAPSGGTAPYTYTWTLNGQVLSGQTGPSVTVTLNSRRDTLVVTVTDANQNTVTATAVCTGTYSPPTVTVGCATGFGYGHVSTFTAVATPAEVGDTLTYSWTLNGTPLTGTGPTISATLNSPADLLVVTVTEHFVDEGTSTATAGPTCVPHLTPTNPNFEPPVVAPSTTLPPTQVLGTTIVAPTPNAAVSGTTAVSGVLASTGTNAVELSFIALLMIGGGTAAAVSVRRRRRHPTY